MWSTMDINDRIELTQRLTAPVCQAEEVRQGGLPGMGIFDRATASSKIVVKVNESSTREVWSSCGRR